MNESHAIQRAVVQISGYLILAVLSGVLAISCGGNDTASTPQQTATSQPQEEAQTTSSQESESGPDRRIQRPAEWILSMRKWPDTVHWEIDSSFTYTVDELRIRFRIDIVQDISGTRFQNERPVLPEILMIVSPIPQWDYARNLAIDSLVMSDPIKNRRLPALPILSFKRSYENETVRTLYYANTAGQYRISPDLDDGQPIDPTLYLTWDDRTIIAELPLLPLKQTLEPAPQGEEELPPDYRTNPPVPEGQP